ncbi:hypothetical protein BS78_07G068100 [Paspalum vaginatum]|nr:hypothetical protein BS78_07G068100 [Paspalum vaginatum]
MQASEDYSNNMERAANSSGAPPATTTTRNTQPNSPRPAWRAPAASSWLSQTTGSPAVRSGCLMPAPDAGAPSAVPRSSLSYAGWHTAVPGAGVVPSAAQRGVAYADCLTAVPGTGAPSAAPRSSAAYADGVMAVHPAGAGAVPPAGRGGVAYADGVMAVPSPGVPRAAPNARVADAAGGGAVVTYTADAPEGAAGRSVFWDPDTRQIRVVARLLRPNRTGNYSSGGTGMALPFTARAVGDVDIRDGAVAEDEAEPERARGGGAGLGGLGLVAASVAVAVAGLTAGGAGAATPACAFGLFATLVAGVALVTAHVLRA